MKHFKDFWHTSLLSKIVLSSLGMITLFLLISITINTTHSENLTKAEIENTSLIGEKEDLLTQLEKQEVLTEETQAELDKIQTEYSEYKESMAPYEELSEEEAKKKTQSEKLEREALEKAEIEKKEKEETDKKAEQERKDKEESDKKAEQERKDKEKVEADKKKQEEEKQKQAAEEAIGYETGLTYEDLARNPDDYLAEKVTFYGRVLQVMEGDGVVQVRLAVDDNYDNIMLIEITEDLITDGRLLEDDFITVKGLSFGLYEYTATLGQSITVPAVIADIVER